MDAGRMGDCTYMRSDEKDNSYQEWSFIYVPSDEGFNYEIRSFIHGYKLSVRNNKDELRVFEEDNWHRFKISNHYLGGFAI
jgi:hypothetical protein